MTKATSLDFWQLEQITVWLERPDWLGDFAIGGASLIERLCNDVVAPDDAHFKIAHGQAMQLLDRIDREINDPQHPIQGHLAHVFSLLTNLIVEAGPYRFEGKPHAPGVPELLDAYREIRRRAVDVMKALFALPIFEPMREAVNEQLNPSLDALMERFHGQDNHYMPFRILTLGGVCEQLRLIQQRPGVRALPELVSLLKALYQFKYIRFGTSGYRGVWHRDFTPRQAQIVAQAVCDFLKMENMPLYAKQSGEDLSGKVIVIGYDGRRNSPQVARMVAEVCLANGFTVYYASRPSPTPALNFFAREVIGRDKLAGLINCTASHNPPEWQGIKFNPKEGYPAPTALTDIIASRSNNRYFLDTPVPTIDTTEAEAEGTFKQFDPKNLYLNYLRQSGQPGADNVRLAINLDNIRRYFAGKLVVIDPMYGSGDGYLSKILGELGVPHVALHDERDEDLGLQTEVIRGIPHLEYANPEPDSIQPLINAVVDKDAVLGLGLDTDADRFGIVDKGGVYIRPNQVLAMLVRYLGMERGEHGRVVITQTGLPMISAIAQQIPGNERYAPPEGTVPVYVSHPFYHHRVGDADHIKFPGVYVVPVGIKYIVDVVRVADDVTDPAKAYSAQGDSEIPATWMDRLLIGGEESSGLTTRGHVPDKDGIWANLLVMDMLAYYGLKEGNEAKTLSDIWRETVQIEGAWNTTGGRIDLDVAHEVKVGILNHYLDLFMDWREGDAYPQLAGLELYYAGGTRYDFVEMFLRDDKYGAHHFLRVRASGTEPILRVYAESEDETLLKNMIDEVLSVLDAKNVEAVHKSYDADHLAELLTSTRFVDTTAQAVLAHIRNRAWHVDHIIEALQTLQPHIDSRNVKLTKVWMTFLKENMG